MIAYRFIKPLLFQANPDKAHSITLKFLSKMPIALAKCMQQKAVDDPTTVMGLNFRNKIGLASGFDKNGFCINALFALGFGHIEVGGVTPEPQDGNPYPHVLRLAKQQSLINHCGLNNHGAKALQQQLMQPRLDGIVGVNIAANKTTPLNSAYQDYQSCLNTLYPYADYFSANISCPNVPGKKPSEQLKHGFTIAESICESRTQLQQQHGIYRPLLLKISPDTEAESLQALNESIQSLPIDGIICGNTSLTRPEGLTTTEKEFTGGLSGKLLFPITHQKLKQQVSLNSTLATIAVGGIHDAASAKQCMDTGADLVQIYTSLVYKGPAVIEEIAKALMPDAN